MKIKLSLLVVLCIVFMNSSSQAQTSFSGTHRRVIGSLDLIRFLHSKFRVSPTDDRVECDQLDYYDHIILGTLLPQEKNRLVEKPEPRFVKWYLECVKNFAYRKLKWSRTANNDLASYESEYNSKKEMLGNDLWMFLLQQSPPITMVFNDGTSTENYINFDNFIEFHWSSVSDTVKKSLVTNLLDYLVGPELILEELQYMGTSSSLVGKPKNISELADVLLSQPITFTEFEGEPTVGDATRFYSTLILSVGNILTY